MNAIEWILNDPMSALMVFSVVMLIIFNIWLLVNFDVDACECNADKDGIERDSRSTGRNCGTEKIAKGSSTGRDLRDAYDENDKEGASDGLC